MKVKFLRNSTVSDRLYEAGEIGDVAGLSARILIEKGRAEAVQSKSKKDDEDKSSTAQAKEE